MKKLLPLLIVPVLLFLQPYGDSKRGSVLADGLKEKTLEVDGNTVEVRTVGDVDVVGVRPYIKTKKGKKKGRLWLDVAIKNTGQKPLAVSVFGQGKGAGGWHGASLKRFPKDGEIQPGKQMTAKVRTGYSGEAVPDLMRVEIFPPM